MVASFGDVKSASGLQSLNKHLAESSYIEGFVPSKADTAIFQSMGGKEPSNTYLHVLRWYKHIKSFTAAETAKFPGATTQSKAAEEEDDDCDLFGSDEEEESEESKRVREERLAAYHAKKSKKPALIAKTSVLLDVKPWDDETDMKVLCEKVKSIEMDGLLWGADKLVPIGYGIKKLTVMCTVEDAKVSIDELQEKIEAFEDYVQSCDVAAMNKI